MVCVSVFPHDLYTIIVLWRCVATRVAYVNGRVAGDERRPAAGRNRGLGLSRASQNRDVTPATWLTRADGRAGGYKQSRRTAAWRLVSQNLMQLGSPNLEHKCSTMSAGNPFILGSKSQRSRSWVTKQCRRGSLHSCEYWLLLDSV